MKKKWITPEIKSLTVNSGSNTLLNESTNGAGISGGGGPG